MVPFQYPFLCYSDPYYNSGYFIANSQGAVQALGSAAVH